MTPGADARSDADLLLASVRDPEAFGRFYDRHAASLLRFFVRRTACAQTAADLTAETFAEAFASRRRFHSTGAPAAAWLFTIARRQLSALVRKGAVDTRARRRLGMERTEVHDDAIERAVASADLAALRTRLNGALSTLPPAMAQAVRLRVVEELPYVEVGRRLGCSEGAARVRVTRGLDRLSNALEDQ